MTLTKDSLKQYLIENVFLIRSPQYSKKYSKWPGQVGVELEMIPVVGDFTKTPTRLGLKNAKTSLVDVFKKGELEGLWKLVWDDEDSSRLMKLDLGQNDYITFEPGAQVEISTQPYPCLDEALNQLSLIRRKLSKNIESMDGRYAGVGIDPWFTVDQIGLQMDKPRYRAMDRYFARIGEYGQRMMRQTCTIQVNLDFGPDESHLVSRYVGSQLLAPIATAIFANSPVVDGRRSEFESFRAWIWRNTDSTRTGILSVGSDYSKLNVEKIVDVYLDSLLKANVVFKAHEEYSVPPSNYSFNDWMKEKTLSPDIEDFKTHMTLHFPEVRAKGFLELRSMDAQLEVWQAIPAIFCTGLLYNNNTLYKLIDYLSSLDQERIYKNCVYGLQDEIIGRAAQKVMELAIEGTSGLPDCYRRSACANKLELFAQNFTFQSKTPASDLLSIFDKSGYISVQELLNLEDRYMRL